MAEITSSYSVVDTDHEFAFPQASKQESKALDAPEKDQSSCLNASPDEILELLKGDHSCEATKLIEESGMIEVDEAPSEDRMHASTMVYSFIGDPGASFLGNVDTKERDWVSIPAPVKPEDQAASIVYDQDTLAKSPENTGWISVDVPGHQKQSDDTCSVPCSLVEWITVDMPPKTGQADASTKRGMQYSEHVCVSFSERTQQNSGGHKYYSAASSQACGIGPVPRTRKRRTISGKIRARIEALENSFRQELDRLNSPLTKVKNRRIHEGLRRGAAAAVAIDEGGVPNFKEVQQRIKRLSLCEEKPPRPIHQLGRFESQAATFPATFRSQVPETVISECQSSQANSDGSSMVPETSNEVKNVSEQLLPELNRGVEPDDEPVKPDNFEDEEWELAGKNGAQPDQEKEFELEGVPVELTEGIPKCKNQTSVGGLVKQVISGAALLAGLIFLWPRGNNLIWRAPQKRKRYNVVTKASSYQEIASYSDYKKSPGNRFNLEVRTQAKLL
ncbi:uncharacterized protein LOC9632914 isoform X1 [Selaginella moellendorffii]|uniref:uncharacterized protein LOC9632914 isoform X1 n=1 Tax=Selaginella moellendorffii TaxID=88036 RepID=UPI000D1C66B2|nr:uncharacterized protein LOC9632914 isoform X1 [Selaginella moellendorffii]|eukprot:XP_024521204.1 uncharacterized protein LOC9632914 isoform X1 [Selaginella moellendorffii]